MVSASSQKKQVPNGTWLVGIGVVLLAPNVVRYLTAIRVHVLPSLLGVFALASGLLAFVGMELPLISLTLIVIGVGIILSCCSPLGRDRSGATISVTSLRARRRREPESVAETSRSCPAAASVAVVAGLELAGHGARG